MTPLSRSRGQRSTCRSRGILRRPPAQLVLCCIETEWNRRLQWHIVKLLLSYWQFPCDVCVFVRILLKTTGTIRAWALCGWIRIQASPTPCCPIRRSILSAAAWLHVHSSSGRPVVGLCRSSLLLSTAILTAASPWYSTLIDLLRAGWNRSHRMQHRHSKDWVDFHGARSHTHCPFFLHRTLKVNVS